MFKKLSVFAVSVLILFAMADFTVAQDEYPILWEDHFEDEADTAAHKNVGWIYYPEEDVQGQTVKQQAGELFVEAGTYGGLVGVGLVETNGVPELVFDENGDPTPATVAAILANNYSDPNQILTFLVNFKRINMGSIFIIVTRMPMDSSRGDSDPTEAPGYPLLLSPLDGAVAIAKYEGSMAALAPDSWIYFGQGGFPFELEVYYWVKYYLRDGDIKVKIWEGEFEDEPAEWLVEGTDPDPRVTGKFTMFGTLGAPPQPGQGDQFLLDDIVTRSSIPGSAVEEAETTVPDDFSLEQNYPNPFNPITSISFTLPEKNMTRLVVYNTMGQVVRTLANSEMAAGNHQITWDGLDENLNPVTSGIYIYRLTSGNHTMSKRLVFMK